ncbi:MAG: hypothetical protein AAF321_11005, partial [Pseudomonadota bacterium]
MTIQNLARRNALKTAGLAGVAAAALTVPARAGSHTAAETASLPDRPVFNKGNLGAFTVMTVLDNARQLPGPHP